MSHNLAIKWVCENHCVVCPAFLGRAVETSVCRYFAALLPRTSLEMATKVYSNPPKQSEIRKANTSVPRIRFYELGLKRVFDLCAVLLSLPFVLPLIGILALLVRRDGGPAFYTQPRVGRDGKIYQILKLRTMVEDADSLLNAYLASNSCAAAEWETTQKLKNDPRVTPIGHILRRCSIDELPQLWNVLVGQMSLIGPRPMMPEQQDIYPGLAYYSQRPGITGLWQVSQRNEGSFAERARFDTDYVANMSFVRDMKILLSTCLVVLNCTGY